MYVIRSKRIYLNGLAVRYFTGGSGEPLVVLHGGNSHAGPWAKNLRELAHKYTVFVPDFPGFGLSQRIEGDYYVPELVNFINTFTDSMGLQQFYLMGHSVGGAVAASYALQNPQRVKKLILIDSMCMGKEISLWVRMLNLPGLTKSLGKGVIGVLKGVKWMADGMFQSMEFILPVSEASIVIGTGAFTLKAQTLVLTKHLAEIVPPTLIVWGNKDRIVPVKHAYAAASIIPDCSLSILGGGHCAYQDRLPEFSQIVSNFLN